MTSLGPIIEYNGNNILINSKINVYEYDLIHVTGFSNEIKNNSDFDLETYLKSINVFSMISNPKVTILEKSNDIRIQITKFLNEGPDYYKEITSLLMLGEKNEFSKDIYDISLRMNVVHLFVISGFHISLFYLVLSKILGFLRINEKYSVCFSLIVIWIYIFFLRFPISATRAGLLTTFVIVNKFFLKKYFTSLELLSFVMIIMLVWKPLSIFSLSFIFTFIASYVIIFINGISFKNKIVKNFSVTFFAYISNILITLYTNHTFAPLGIVFGVILVPIFIFMYLITFIIFPFKTFLNWIDYAFIWLMKSLDQLNYVIKVSSISLESIFLSYGFFWTTLIMFKVCEFYMAKKFI